MFNLPPAVFWLLVVLVAVHAVRSLVLDAEGQVSTLLLFAFIPARYSSEVRAEYTFPGGEFGDLWTFVTYAFLHGDWMHLAVNAAWLMAFGSAVEQRFGIVRFLGLAALSAAGGAALHLVIFPGDETPVVGASAALSGLMAAAARFLFGGNGGPVWGRRDSSMFRRPAPSLLVAFANRSFLIFVGAWLGINVLFGTGIIPIAGAGQAVAWQAHIGGFAVGLLFFSLFDPIGGIGRRPPVEPDDDDFPGPFR